MVGMSFRSQTHKLILICLLLAATLPAFSESPADTFRPLFCVSQAMAGIRMENGALESVEYRPSRSYTIRIASKAEKVVQGSDEIAVFQLGNKDAAFTYCPKPAGDILSCRQSSLSSRLRVDLRNLRFYASQTLGWSELATNSKGELVEGQYGPVWMEAGECSYIE